MSRKRDLELAKYGISKWKYRELLYFCMQYQEKRHMINYGLGAVNQDGMPKGNKTSDLTGGNAISNVQLQSDVEVIEQTAIQTDADLYPYILKNVTEGIAYEYMDIPCGRRAFYEMRKLFFYYLSKKR